MYTLNMRGEALFGIGAVKEELPKLVDSLNMTKILLVTDEILVKLGVADIVTAILTEKKLDFEVFDKVLPDNPSHVIYDGIKGIKEEGINGVIGLGGGSALDCAKAMNIMISKNLDTLDEHFTTRTGYFALEPFMPMIAIPTTAGTGSEVSGAAGVKDVSIPKKESIYGTGIVPTVAIVDAELQKGMPPMVTLSTGLDAMSHALEPLFSRTRNHITRAYGLEAIRTIVKNLPIVVQDGSNLEARQHMAESATMAIITTTHGLLHIGHGVSHATGGQWNIPHGIATAHVLFPMVEYLADVAPDSVEDLLYIFGAEAGDNPGKALRKAMEDFAYGMELPKLSAFPKTNLDEMDGVVKAAQGFMAPRSVYLAKPLPSDEWVREAIMQSV